MRQVYCSFEQLYRRLRLPRSYLRALARRGAIPYLLVGGRMKFDEDAVHEVLHRMAASVIAEARGPQETSPKNDGA